MALIQILNIRSLQFNPKELTAEIEVIFSKDGKHDNMKGQYYLKNPEEIFNKILLEVKSKNKMIFDDPRLSPVELLERYSPIKIHNEEQTEEKMFNFIRMLCEKARILKNTKEAREHMRILNEFKTTSLKL